MSRKIQPVQCSLIAVLILVALISRPASPETIETGKFRQQVADYRNKQQGLTSKNVLSVSKIGGRIVIQTSNGFAEWLQDTWASLNQIQPPKQPDLPADLTQLDSSDDQKRWALASPNGLYERIGGQWQKLVIKDGKGRLWADHDVRGVTYDNRGRLWCATVAGVAVRQVDNTWRLFDGNDGLPYSDFTCAESAPDGSIWFGTRRGAIHYDGERWAYRQGPRWLPDDDVRDIFVDDDNTVWFATADGVGCIKHKMITLEEKAAYYEDQIERLIKRTSYGYVATARLAQPGDLTDPTNHDSDNDGLWTAMYGASQCYAYAVTKSDIARKRATQAFHALRFLQKVTQGGEHSPPKGYVARTILPTSGPNPNIGRRERDIQFQATRDRMWKVYEPRWPKSADGKWYWKSDTSSDELDGHYFLYALYYDLVAESDEEKNQVREVVRDLTNHLIDHDFVLQDHDGQPTRWANYRPSVLNHDIRWIDERGLNSLSMLSYLAVAGHITGDERYETVSHELIEKHAYATNLMVPKVQRGIGSGNHSDDEMAFMAFYNLIRNTSDQALRDRYLTAFYSYWLLEQPERNPFFHFAYAAVGNGVKTESTFGPRDLSPKGDWLIDSADALKRFPLDRAEWAHANSHRLDIRRLPRQQTRNLFALEPDSQGTRGYRVDGKVLPVDERSFNHWNTDPWQLDYGGDGRTLGSGTVFLLPYYMGRYHGFIE